MSGDESAVLFAEAAIGPGTTVARDGLPLTGLTGSGTVGQHPDGVRRALVDIGPEATEPVAVDACHRPIADVAGDGAVVLHPVLVALALADALPELAQVVPVVALLVRPVGHLQSVLHLLLRLQVLLLFHLLVLQFLHPGLVRLAARTPVLLKFKSAKV